MAQYFTYQDQKIAVGDTVRVHEEISEGDKTRIQIFEGLIIAVKNRGNGKSVTVRKIGSNGVGVEKIIPLQMPQLKKLELKRKGSVKRAKLYYLRERIGKSATRVKEKSTVIKTETVA
ncbi:MAG: 50S ribosomal protein L19 [Microgenomates group bacterium]